MEPVAGASPLPPRTEDATDLETIDEATVQMAEWAHELGGQYDGWETSVEKGR